MSSLGTIDELPCVCRKAHARLPQLLTVSIWTHPGSNPKEWQGSGSVSRSCALRRPEAGVIAEDATQLVRVVWDVGGCQGRLRKVSVAIPVGSGGAVSLRQQRTCCDPASQAEAGALKPEALQRH